MPERQRSHVLARAGTTKSAPTTRVVGLLDGGQEYCNNEVITSHYTVLNFWPKNLAEQFSKPANVYFAFLSILQMIPSVTVTNQFPTVLIPLVSIVCLNALKDALEDWRRHQSDREENDRRTLCMKDSSVKIAGEERWTDIRVGSVVVVREDEFIPADLVILSSAHSEGQIMIETMNLDGETNLKTKEASKEVRELVGTAENFQDICKKVARMEATIECDLPNEFLYQYTGTMTLGSKGEEPKKLPLDEENLVLRGCKMRNTTWCIGLVVYTGKQTKIMMNSIRKKGRKLSHLENMVSYYTLAIFLIQLVLCIIAAAKSASFESSEDNRYITYLNLWTEDGKPVNQGALVFLSRFLTFVILFSNFIPISLLLSMAMVKIIQIFFFYKDEDMIYQKYACIPRTSDLNEELGQIEYVFSDKTGTLTRNVMEFQRLCVNGVTYGEGLTEIKRNVLIRSGQPVPVHTENEQTKKRGRTPHVDLVDEKLDAILEARSGRDYMAVREFFLNLAVNHEVVVRREKTKDSHEKVAYSASSPDETALCYGAKHFGFKFAARHSKGIAVSVEGREMEVNILAMLKFTSSRKRSSVVAEFQEELPDGSTKQRLVLFCKGADSVIMARLSAQQQQSEMMPKSLEVVREMAEDGLRTLCLAGRELSGTEWNEWNKKYQEALSAVQNRQDRIDEAADELERNLIFHGITGIEDRLQKGVAQTIIAMIRAGIKVWMLTGDKVETAINIGIATGLLEPESAEDKGDRPILTAQDFTIAGQFQHEQFAAQLAQLAKEAADATDTGHMYEGLVIDGRCLEAALMKECERSFVDVCKFCKTVLCCRVSPKQKGAVVRLIKGYLKAVTLAIGDGANDCNMIQSADVGIGIRGKEGLQAFNVCDYGISQFRFLQNLLLVHGRWCYRRMAILVNYTFYKNVVVVMAQYFMGSVSQFSGQKLYHDAFYQLYNVVHSTLPIIAFAVLDQDVSKRISLKAPELYTLGHSNTYLNKRVAAGWLLRGFWHAAVAFWLPYLTMSNGQYTHSDGKANDIWMVGTVVYLVVVIVVNIVVVLESCYWNWIIVLMVFLSLLGWYVEQGWLSGYFMGTVVTTELWGTTQRLFSSPMLLLVCLAVVVVCLMVDVHVKGFKVTFFPTILHKIQAKVLEEKASQKNAPTSASPQYNAAVAALSRSSTGGAREMAQS